MKFRIVKTISNDVVEVNFQLAFIRSTRIVCESAEADF